MLNSLRKSATGIFVKILLGLLVISFVAWGIQDFFSGRTDTTIAEVGDVNISANSFTEQFRRQLRYLQMQSGQTLSTEQARLYGVDDGVLNQMINDTAMELEAARIGIVASDKSVLKRLSEDERFFGPTGHYDPMTLRQILQSNGISETVFLTEQQANLRRDQIASAIVALVTAPETIVNALYRALSEQRIAEYFILSPAMVGDIPNPSESELKKYYDTQTALFVIPEYRGASIVTVRAEDLAKDISLSEKELREEYARRTHEFVTPEKRVVDQLPFKNPAAARTAWEEINKGKSLEEIAKAQGFKPEEIALGAVTREQMLSPEIASAVFSLAVGKVSAPVEGPLGTVLLRVREIQPGSERKFEEVRDIVQREATLDQARNKLYEFSNSIEDARAGGDSLKEIADHFNLSLRKIEAVDAQGQGTDGKPIADIPNATQFLKDLFAYDVGEEVPMGETADGAFYWMDVDDIQPARRKPLAEVRDDVRARYINSVRTRRLSELATQLVDKGNKGTTMADIAKTVGAKVSTSEPLSRNTNNDIFSIDATKELFTAAASKFAQGPSGKEGARLIMRVKATHSSEPTPETPGMNEFRQQLASDMNNDLIQQFVAALRAREGVNIHKSTFDRALGAPDDTTP